MDTTYVLIAVLAVVLIISIISLARNKNLRQQLRLPGVSWDMESTDDNTKGQDTSKSVDRSRVGEGSDPRVDFGEQNRLEGTIGNIAGRDVLGGDGSSSSKRDSSGSSGVTFGKDNVFSGQIGDVAGRDIVKKPGQDAPNRTADDEKSRDDSTAP